MEQYIIKGGNSLAGEVEITGAKNAALAILAASTMTDDTVIIENMPDEADTNILLATMNEIGVFTHRTGRHTVRVNAAKARDMVIDNDALKKIRASYYLIGAMLGKFKHARVVLPGGCAIGLRPVDQHMKGFSALGAECRIEHGYIVAEARELHGAHIYLDVVSVGATINIMMAATLAQGQTIIENAAKEPHVVDLANFLNSMGARIKGAGTDVIRIRGVERLHGTEYAIIPDQIEAGTFMMASAVTRGDITVRGVIPKHLESISAKLKEMGCEIHEEDDAVRVICKERLKSTHVKTLPYPGFPTDMQPQITVALGLASGVSIVTESIFENRFKYIDELVSMGANIKVEGSTAIISGEEKYTGAHIVAPDLRAGAALVLAGLVADGFTTIDNIRFIERGYEDFYVKLQTLGARIERVEDERSGQKFRLKYA
jgi:UDP-N-acetylglucosamine 1-carboxyvinyltransferase